MNIEHPCDELILSARTEGFIFVPRKMIKEVPPKGERLSEYESLHVMYGLVNFVDKYFNKKGVWVTCRRGESVRSLQTWGKHFGWFPEEVGRFFDKLIRLGYLERPENPIDANHIRMIHFDRITGRKALIEELQGSGDLKGVQTPDANNKKRGDDETGYELYSGPVDKPPVITPSSDMPLPKDPLFEHFWQSYHEVTGVVPLGRSRARKKWSELTKEQQDLAIDRIEVYYHGLVDRKYCCRAVSYLEKEAFD